MHFMTRLMYDCVYGANTDGYCRPIRFIGRALAKWVQPHVEAVRNNDVVHLRPVLHPRTRGMSSNLSLLREENVHDHEFVSGNDKFPKITGK